MPHALEIFLDPASETAVANLWSTLDRNGLPSLGTASHGKHRPHISLASADAIAITPALIDAVAALRGMRITLPAIGIFPGTEGVLFLGVTATRPLLDAHAAVHGAVGDGDDGYHRLYAPGIWVPHATLAVGLDGPALSKSLGLLHPFSVLDATIADVGLVDTVTGDITPLVF